MNKESSGFTLIELLVVIAIIGVLSSIIISSLNDSRVRATDTKIKAQLSSLRSAAEVYYYANNNTYGSPVNGNEGEGESIGTGCASGMFGNSVLTPYTLKANYPSYSVYGRCTSDGTNYAVSGKLHKYGSYWCVDSRGVSKPSSMHGPSEFSCPP